MAEPVLRSLGIDPGSFNLGYAVLDASLDKFNDDRIISRIGDMGYLSVEQVSRWYNDNWYQREERHRRLKAAAEFAVGLVETYRPDIVILEDAYLNRRQPTSYRSLSEGLIYLTEAIWDYDDSITLITIEAMRAKKAVGCKPKRGDDQKKIVKDAIIKHPDIILSPDFHEMAEHAVDAVALAQWGINEWWEENRYFYI